MKIQPIGNNILVNIDSKQETVDNGIILPPGESVQYNTGSIVAVGDGIVDEKGKVIPPTVKVDDKIIMPVYGGTQIKIDENDYCIMRDTDVLGIILED